MPIFPFQTFKDPDTSIMSTIPLLHITREDKECLKDAFALFDADKDGEITTEELAKVKQENRKKSYKTCSNTSIFRS